MGSYFYVMGIHFGCMGVHKVVLFERSDCKMVEISGEGSIYNTYPNP